MIESIFSMLFTEDDTCLNDIYATRVPDPICPFGCKKDNCPYNFDASKCPHNLDMKGLGELSDYLLKMFYYKSRDKDGEVGPGQKNYREMASPEMLEAIKKFKRPGNVTS